MSIGAASHRPMKPPACGKFAPRRGRRHAGSGMDTGKRAQNVGASGGRAGAWSMVDTRDSARKDQVGDRTAGVPHERAKSCVQYCDGINLSPGSRMRAKSCAGLPLWSSAYKAGVLHDRAKSCAVLRADLRT